MNQLVDAPADGFVEVQVKNNRRIGAEVAMPHAHHRHWTLKARVVNLDAHPSLYQLRRLVFAVFGADYAIHLEREVAPNLDVGDAGVGVADDYVVVEFEIPRLRSQVGGGMVRRKCCRRIPQFGLHTALDLGVGEGHLLTLQFHGPELDGAPGGIVIEFRTRLAAAQNNGKAQCRDQRRARSLHVLLFSHLAEAVVKWRQAAVSSGGLSLPSGSADQFL
jgi:hypothetical protein